MSTSSFRTNTCNLASVQCNSSVTNIITWEETNIALLHAFHDKRDVLTLNMWMK